MLRPRGILGDRTHVLTMAEPRAEGAYDAEGIIHQTSGFMLHEGKNAVTISITRRPIQSLGMWVDGHAFFCDLQSHT